MNVNHLACFHYVEESQATQKSLQKHQDYCTAPSHHPDDQCTSKSFCPCISQDFLYKHVEPITNNINNITKKVKDRITSPSLQQKIEAKQRLKLRRKKSKQSKYR
jgi:hypothetical protein